MMSIMFLMSILMIFYNHPMSMGANLILQTIMIVILIGPMNYSFWFSYILFLIMIGGMLILFMYMTSIASNEKFKFSINLLIIIMMMFMITYFLNKYFIKEFNFKMMENMFFNQYNFNNFNKYYNLNFQLIY
uniref:NADH-ubiquinone oxidoreductase chain 6 n=1 Tax=Glena unipennaria TaxID=1981046 RepID=A0A343YVI8_9NEOP|nr:NADH dehydrogenase subunit 6 [Glena unipennaria]